MLKVAIPVVGALVLSVVGCDRQPTPVKGADSTFAAMQERGATAMGVDQYSSEHMFEPTRNGGRIVLRRDPADSVGVAAIRRHMSDIATRFGNGDFAIPGFVHAQAVPGTDVLSAKRAQIQYTADTLRGGGMITIATSDPAAIDAVHRFLAFQRTAHHSGMQMHGMNEEHK